MTKPKRTAVGNLRGLMRLRLVRTLGRGWRRTARAPEKRMPASEQFAAQTSVSINRVQLDRVGNPLLHAGHQSADVIGANVGCATGEMLKPLSNNNVTFNSELLEVGMDSIVW